MTEPKIHCLFSLDNDYNQPGHNLVAFWHTKPTLGQVVNALSRNFPGRTDEETLAIVNIWNGNTARFDGTDYWVQEVAPIQLVANQ